MIYLRFTHVDALTKKPVSEQPAVNGPVFPDVKGLAFGFALESLYPTSSPVLYGTAPDDTDLSTPGILERVQESAYDAAMLAELEARETKEKSELSAVVVSTRYAKETAGFKWRGLAIATDGDSQSKIRAERGAAKDGRRKDGDVWKCADSATGVTIYRPTTNEEMVEIGDLAYFRTQACYARESVLMAAVADGTYTADMLKDGWPE